MIMKILNGRNKNRKGVEIIGKEWKKLRENNQIIIRRESKAKRKIAMLETVSIAAKISRILGKDRAVRNISTCFTNDMKRDENPRSGPSSFPELY